MVYFGKQVKIKQGGGVIEIEDIVLRAASDEDALNELINGHHAFILKCASASIGRYITDSDDEYSIALIGFTHAVKSYDISKGNFFGFAQLVIKRRLIDYLRSNAKYQNELLVSPHIFDTEPDENDENISLKLAVADKIAYTENRSIRDEIISINERFSHYGFSFMELTDCSPKAEKTKISCAKAVAYILKNPLLINEIYTTCQLPMKILEKNSVVPRKILERHRKYIIAAVEIFSGEYPCLAEYMQFIRKELQL